MSLQASEPDVERARRLVDWADHLVFVYPTWWGTMPSLMKGFGALAIAGSDALGTARFWLGYLVVFCIEAATVFSNELFDYPANRGNRRYGPFNGGSRVIIDARISVRELGAAAWIAGALAVLFAIALVVSGAPPVPSLVVIAVLAIVAIGYTVPPLKLCYRTLGELDVAFTHGPAVIVCGWVFMGGEWSDPVPWLIGVPIALAALPSITLANVPDRQADEAVGKWTIAARFGQRGAIRFAMFATVAAVACAVVWPFFDRLPRMHWLVPWLAVPYGGWLLWLLGRALAEESVPRNMMTLMLVSLTFVLPFILPPFFALL